MSAHHAGCSFHNLISNHDRSVLYRPLGQNNSGVHVSYSNVPIGNPPRLETRTGCLCCPFPCNKSCACVVLVLLFAGVVTCAYTSKVRVQISEDGGDATAQTRFVDASFLSTLEGEKDALRSMIRARKQLARKSAIHRLAMLRRLPSEPHKLDLDYVSQLFPGWVEEETQGKEGREGREGREGNQGGVSIKRLHADRTLHELIALVSLLAKAQLGEEEGGEASSPSPISVDVQVGAERKGGERRRKKGVVT